VVELAPGPESGGVSSVDGWLCPLFEPLARWTVSELQAQIDGATLDLDGLAPSISHEAIKGAKNILDEYARSSGTPDHAPLFTATCRVYSDSEVIQ
jgi:hypothetical protein